MQNIEDKVDEIKKMLEDFIEQSDDRFASKWVERAVWGSAAVVGGAIILTGVSFLLKQPLPI